MDHGCTQGDVDSPIIFNIIIDAVLRSWKHSGEFCQSDSCFYADDGLIQHQDPTALQKDLDHLLELFSKIGLKPNASKTKFMIFCGAPAPRAKSRANYNKIHRSRGLDSSLSDREWRKLQTTCNICGKELANGSLQRHMTLLHQSSSSIHDNKYTCRETQNNGSYSIQFRQGRRNQCPVPNCPGGGKDKFGMYRHFCLLHPEANIVIEEDGILPKCLLCGMRVKGAMSKHQQSFTCKRGASRRANEIKQDRQFEAGKVKFYVGGEEIEQVRHFKYLGRILSEDDDDTKCIEHNLSKARKQWNCISRILKQEGASAKCMAKFYITVVQAVLLYGADSWTISRRNERKLVSFHRQAVCYLTNTHIQKLETGTWFHPTHDPLFRKCGLFLMETYLERRRGTLRKYLETYRGSLLRRAENCNKHCFHVGKVLWWDQPYLFKEDMDHSDFWYK